MPEDNERALAQKENGGEKKQRLRNEVVNTESAIREIESEVDRTEVNKKVEISVAASSSTSQKPLELDGGIEKIP